MLQNRLNQFQTITTIYAHFYCDVGWGLTRLVLVVPLCKYEYGQIIVYVLYYWRRPHISASYSILAGRPHDESFGSERMENFQCGALIGATRAW